MSEIDWNAEAKRGRQQIDQARTHVDLARRAIASAGLEAPPPDNADDWKVADALEEQADILGEISGALHRSGGEIDALLDRYEELINPPDEGDDQEDDYADDDD
jgi:hypothetical protein